MQCRSRAGPSLFSKKTASLRYQFYVQPGRYRACTVCLTFGSMDPATALPPAPPQRKATSSAESESSSAHEEDDLSLASDWTNEDERASQGDGQPRVNDKSPTIDKDVQDSLLAVSTSATDVETLRYISTSLTCWNSCITFVLSRVICSTMLCTMIVSATLKRVRSSGRIWR